MINHQKTKLSFVIPVFNEDESLEELYQQIRKQYPKTSGQIEFIFINDGSTDRSLEVIKKLRSRDPQIKIISFRKNMGKAEALNQGFKKAQGQIVVTLDADLQDGPENLPTMIKKLDEGYDLVVGWKKIRNDPVIKKIPSKMYNRMVRGFSKVPLHDFNSGLKVMKREVAEEIRLYGELHRFVPVLAAQQGFKVSEVPVIHHPRLHGRSKYSFLTVILRGSLDFMTVMYLGNYGKKPLHLFGNLGSISIILGVGMGIYLSVLHFQGESISQRPLLTLAVLLIMAGLQLYSTGFIAEMLVNKFQSRDRLPIEYESD